MNALIDLVKLRDPGCGGLLWAPDLTRYDEGQRVRADGAIPSPPSGGGFLFAGPLLIGAVPHPASDGTVCLADVLGVDLTRPAPTRPDRATDIARLLLELSRRPDVDAVALGMLAPTLDSQLGTVDMHAIPGVAALLDRWGVTLPSASAAHNHLRRGQQGIHVLSGVSVPLRDGTRLEADVFLPWQPGSWPVLLRLSIYGNAFGNGSACTPEQRTAAERREDDWFTGDPSLLGPMLRYSETVVSANPSTWVPRGYALVRINGRGVGHSPGVFEPFSQQEAEDFYDAIEWAAEQPWSTGRVGLYGASYNATVQWHVASLKPPSLKAIMPFAGDSDAFRDLSHPGGIFNEGYRNQWWANLAAAGRCSDVEVPDLIAWMRDHPFDDPDRSDGPLSVDFSQIDIPVYTAISQTAVLHGRSGVEAFQRLNVPSHLAVVDASYFADMYGPCLADQEAFFDEHLKGVTPVTAPPKVRVLLRTGHGGSEWLTASTWPLPSTQYQVMLLDAGDTADHHTMTASVPACDGIVAYWADRDRPLEERRARFVSTPFTQVTDLAGHLGVQLWVSADAHDMDVFAALRVVDADGREIPYAVHVPGSTTPMTWGCLRASHRTIDPSRSAPFQPWHTHRRSDHRPLTGPDEVVLMEFELCVATARIPLGGRLQLDLTPVETPPLLDLVRGEPMHRAYDESFHVGVVNRIHTGPTTPSALRIPVIASHHEAGERR